MAVINLTLKDGSRFGKWGKVFAIDGSMPEFKITEAELAALHASSNGVPPGLTRAQWESGAYAVAGHDFIVGDVLLEADGSVLFKYHERVVAGKIKEYFANVPAGDWSGVYPNISIEPIILNPFQGLISVSVGVVSVDTAVI